MSRISLTPRQEREIRYYDEYAVLQEQGEVDFGPVTGGQSRPWNPYWRVYELARQRYAGPWQRALDFGCGTGLASVRLARMGYQVDGFDLASINVELANKLARRCELESRCRFAPMAAEALEYESDSFDLLIGIDILHHVDIAPAIEQAWRVLRKGGMAVFKEHVESPVFEPLRNSALGRAIAPRETSLEHHITADERKLTQADVDLIGRRFTRMEQERFTLLARLERLLPRQRDNWRGRLQRLDRRLLHLCPPLARLGGTILMLCWK